MNKRFRWPRTYRTSGLVKHNGLYVVLNGPDGKPMRATLGGATEQKPRPSLPALRAHICDTGRACSD
jgi:hypothetical protein